jgi:hypothetical protein
MILKFLVVVLSQTQLAVGASPDWIGAGIRDLRQAKTSKLLQAALARSRTGRSLEASCDEQLKGSQFPDVCLALLGYAEAWGLSNIEYRRNLLRQIENRCSVERFPPRKVKLNSRAVLSQKCQERIRSHNQDQGYIQRG